MIYAHEASFSHALGLSFSSPEVARAWGEYITRFKDQWAIVTWFGVATNVLAVIILFVSDPRGGECVSPAATTQ